jgi:hypothetical protein
MHLKVIYNPAAGRGRARRNVREVEEYLRSRGARVDCEPSTGPSDLVRIAAESSRAGYDRVVVCGGDGTLNLAIREFDLAKERWRSSRPAPAMTSRKSSASRATSAARATWSSTARSAKSTSHSRTVSATSAWQDSASIPRSRISRIAT